MLTNVSGVYENNKGSQIYVEGLKRYQKRGIRVLIDGKDACEETWGKLFEVREDGSFYMGDYILEDIPNHLNVYVYAPDEARLKNCVENLQMDPQTAKKMMRDVDAARNRYHKAYIPGWQSVFDHKDLMIDSSRFGIDGTAKILADIVRNQWG